MYNYNCNKPCRLCNRLVMSQSVTVVTVNGIDTLVIDLPSANYMNKTTYCIIIVQPIPTTATISMPVAISIGGITTTVYPLTTKNCLQVTACQISTHTKYKTCVATNGVSGSFRVLNDLPCSRIEPLPSIPIAEVTPAPATRSKATISKITVNKEEK